MTSTPAERKATWRRIYLELKRARKYLQSPDASLGGVLLAAKRTLEHRRDVRLRIRAARDAYPALPIAAAKDSFMLVRIIGNDLEPRHRKGQSFDNASFILDNEPAFPDCDKFWIVNRIADPDEEARIIGLLEGRGQSFVRIPFDLEAYGKIAWDIDGLAAKELRLSGKSSQSAELTARYETLIRRSKNRYLMNNNGARNKALEIARTRAKWLMPWDGNCYLTEQAFRQIRGAIEARPYLPYVIVPMARIVENSGLLDENFEPPAREEPQIIFRTDTTELFDENYAYGRRPKVEMLWRLGVPGPWDRFRDDPWDFPRPSLAPDAGLFQNAGWVARLDSGRAHLEIGRVGFVARWSSRDEAIVDMIDRCDALATAARLDPSRLVFYDDAVLAAVSQDNDVEVRRHLETAAEQALARAPAADLHRAGDPARLRHVLHDATVLALAAAVLGEQRFAAHAAQWIRTCFIDPDTRMNPSRAKQGVFELGDLHFFLDAVRLVERAGMLTGREREDFRTWLGTYGKWLATTPATEFGKHGVLSDLQRTSIAMFLNDDATLARVRLYARERLGDEIAPDGSLLNETSNLRDAMLALQGWTALARVLSAVGDDLWRHQAAEGQGLVTALRRFAADIGRQDIETIDRDLARPLLLDLACHDPATPALDVSPGRSLFHPDRGIAPFWVWRRQ
ncbi:alginate lyase family protein [Mesorhizobium sp. WSM4303]|uniref:alginate lyase family protein n=1 Tax=unclassified Mesorhizobium TaxID=325217 RepID=UPI00115D3388|nr:MULTISPECIES: alginate lyase family protein [unclassified Mesorhizobium]TRC98933.1 alginate lyase family protein [Mesorhizobium sp. WSM4306]TRD07018.1 alginate lyase family protein [Mesorhizobium sp. WSM4303]